MSAPPLPTPAVVPFGGSSPIVEADRALLGGKGAGLATMCSLGCPVPPGFTITTPVCNYYYDAPDHYPGAVTVTVEDAIAALEHDLGQTFGRGENPLLVSVRSGAPISMPGMMDTVLNVGLNPDTVESLARRTGNRRFALDCYRRLVEMYGNVVAGVDSERFSARLEAAKESAGVQRDFDLTAEHLESLVEEYLAIFEQETGAPFPTDPRQQLWGAIDAVFDSWMAPRAVTYRRIHGIANKVGTAVNVQTMVFGNLGPTSATGVCFTRDPATGESTLFGEYLRNAQGEDIVAGVRTPRPIRTAEGGEKSFEHRFPAAYEELLGLRDQLERHYRDMLDLEFTVQENRLFLLQTRSGQRTGAAALRIATDLVDEGICDAATALGTIDAEGLSQVLAPAFARDALADAADLRVARGLPASPGAASGHIAFTANEAVAMENDGAGPVVLVRVETCPEDIAGMEVAAGIVTARGGKTSHAAVVARGMGKPCIVGCEQLTIDENAGTITTAAGETLRRGDEISIDGASGQIFRGAIAVRDPEVLRVLADELPAEKSAVYRDFSTVMEWADNARALGVRTNCDTPEDAALARRLGASGIGLCRTEHMFFGAERILAFRRMILASDESDRRAALDTLLPYQREDFLGIFRAMHDLPVTIRLLDPPLHEFLPHGTAEIAELAAQLGRDVDEVQARVEASRESNPMLGLRGCRLGLTHPEIYETQVRAIFEAAADAVSEGVTPIPEVMIPLTALRGESERLRAMIAATAASTLEARGVDAATIDSSIGTMIEIPRAALTADEIAEDLDFFSFGTNDLTQMTLGLSRDDTAQLLLDYVHQGILPRDPFASLDVSGVGALIEIGVQRGRTAKPGLKVGICGEHGGDPRSVAFCHGAGFDYVSCSPYRLPIARLAAAQAATRDRATSSSV